MLRKASVLVGLLAFLGSLTSCDTAKQASEPKGSIVLVKEGLPAASIVIRGDAGWQIKTAAEDLRDYIERISGAVLPIVSDEEDVQGTRILIGSSKATEGIEEDLSEERLGYDGCVAGILGNELVFLGPRDAGAANGVYWFLEWVLDVHWFGLRDDSLVLPNKHSIIVEEFYYAHKPSFAWRASWISSIQAAYTEQEAANCGKALRFNHRDGIELSGAHSLCYLVPDSLFAEHPEYFPLIDGKRTAKRAQLCLSNPEVLRIVVETLKERNQPDAFKYESVSPNDCAGWCECEACRQMAEDPAARMMLFCNQVIEALEETHPRLGACFLAYDHSRTLEPPLGYKGHPRVVPLIAPLGVISVHPLDSNCPNSVALRKVYEGWSEVCPGGTTTYPYMFGGPLAGALPLPVPAVVARDTQYYYKAGLMGVQREHVGHYYARGLGWELSFWLEWQLFWDIKQDVGKLRKTFFTGYFGAAAEPMARIYERIESAVINSPVGSETAQKRGREVSLCSKKLYRSLLPTLAANRSDLLEAMRLADTPWAKTHVEIDGLALTAIEEYVTSQNAYAKWKENKTEPTRQAAVRRIEAAKVEMDKIVERAPYMKQLRKSLDSFLEELKG